MSVCISTYTYTYTHNKNLLCVNGVREFWAQFPVPLQMPNNVAMSICIAPPPAPPALGIV